MSSICTVQLKVNSKNDRQGAKNMVPTSKTSYFVCGTSVSSCLLIQRTSKHLGHNHIPLHIFLDKWCNTLVLSVLSNLPKGQRVGQGKQKTHLTTKQVDLNFFFMPWQEQRHCTQVWCVAHSPSLSYEPVNFLMQAVEEILFFFKNSLLPEVGRIVADPF